MDYIGYKSISGFYDRVRSLIGSSASDLPDDILDFYEKAPSSERKLLKRVGSLEEIQDEKLPILESCVVYQTAIDTYNTAHFTSGIKVKQTQNLKVEYFEGKEIDNLLETLEAKLEYLIEELLGEEHKVLTEYRFEISQ